MSDPVRSRPQAQTILPACLGDSDLAHPCRKSFEISVIDQLTFVRRTVEGLEQLANLAGTAERVVRAVQHADAPSVA